MPKGEYEVVVIGAGAAGIAAARRLREAGIDALLVEARSRIGGRGWTVDISGAPIDLGCGWLHSADRNPWVAIAEGQGRSIDRTPPPWTRAATQVGIDPAQRSDFAAALQKFRDRADALADDGADRPAAAFLEPGCVWNSLLDAVSTWYSGAELDRVSARDLQRYDDTGVNWRIREGYGATIGAHGANLPTELACKVERIDRGGSRLRIETALGAILARAAIVTLPSAALANAPELFSPALPAKTEAAAGLPLGLADKLFLSLDGAEEFEPESRSFGSLARTRTAAYHFRPFGRPMIECYFGGALAGDLEAGGQSAFHEFAAGELAGLFGGDFARRVRPLGVHCWGADPFSRGSYSFASPGRADCRAALAAPVDDRLFFAGEACSREDYSTAHGAYITGVAAADAAIAAMRSSARVAAIGSLRT